MLLGIIANHFLLLTAIRVTQTEEKLLELPLRRCPLRLSSLFSSSCSLSSVKLIAYLRIFRAHHHSATVTPKTTETSSAPTAPDTIKQCPWLRLVTLLAHASSLSTRRDNRVLYAGLERKAICSGVTAPKVCPHIVLGRAIVYRTSRMRGIVKTMASRMR